MLRSTAPTLDRVRTISGSYAFSPDGDRPISPVVALSIPSTLRFVRLIPRIALCVVLLSGSLPAASPDPSTHRLSTVELDDVTMERAEKIIIPRFEIKDLTPAEALEAIRKKIREVSPSEDLKFEEKYEPIKAGDSQPPSPAIPGMAPSRYTPIAPSPAASQGVTLSLANIPVSETLRYVVGLSGGRLEVVRGAAFLAHLTTRTLPFVFNDPVLCDELGIDPKIAEEIRKDPKHYLRRFGITFHPGTELQALAGGRSLFVRHTEEALNLIQQAHEDTIPTPIPGPEVPKQKPDAAAPMRQHAEKLILGEVSLLNVTLLEATDRLTELSRLWDVNEPSPEKRGIQVSVELENSSGHRFLDWRVAPRSMDLFQSEKSDMLRRRFHC